MSIAGASAVLLLMAAPSSLSAKPDETTIVVTARKRPQASEAPPSLEVYAAPSRFERIALSPDGAQAAYVMTQGGGRVVATQRLADKTSQLAKLTGGPVSSIGWADDDHVLITRGFTTLRGTCEPNDEQEIADNASATQLTLQDMATDALSKGQTGGVTAQSLRAAAMTIAATSLTHPCVYYGVREESAAALIDMASKGDLNLGLRFGGKGSRPMGAPMRVSLNGKPTLEGPFLQVSLDELGMRPAEPIFLWSVDAATPNGRRIKDGGDPNRGAAYVDDWLLDRSGIMIARSLYDFASRNYVIQMKVNGEWKPVLTRLVLPQEHTFAPFLVGLAPHPGSIVILDVAKGCVGGGGRLFHYYELSRDGALSDPLEPDDAARDHPITNAATGKIAGFRRAGVEDSYAFNDPQLQSLYQLGQNAAPGETVEIVSTADDPRKMVIHTEGGEDPGSFYFVDFGQGKSILLGEDHPDLPGEWVASQSIISYKTSDGLDIQALLTLPPSSTAARNLPLVVLPHDGPGSHDRRGFDWFAQALASRGYIVLQPQYRGSDNSSPSLVRAAEGQLGRKMQSDLSDGVRALISQGLVDPRRVCIAGVGMGGYAALMGAMEAATYRCAISINGVSDPKAYEATLKSRLVRTEQDQITTLVADLERPRDFDANPASPKILAGFMGSDPPAPIKLTASVAAPLLLVQAADDKLALVQQSRAMQGALLAAGKAVELVELKGSADHALATKDARLEVLKAVISFLAKNDPPG